MKVTRQSFQRGYVSDPIKTRRGVAYKIRYRVPGPNGGWKQKAETLYVEGKKAANAIVQQRIGKAVVQTPEAGKMTVREFVQAYWLPYLDRKHVKPSTKLGYLSVLNNHVFPTLGDLRLCDVGPLHVEQLLQSKHVAQSSKMKRALSQTTIRNVLAVLQGIFSFAEDNELVARSPIRKRHKPAIQRKEKPVWTPEQVRAIIAAVPDQFRCLFLTVALTGVRLGELLALQWKHVNFQERTLRIEQSLWKGQLVLPKTEESIATIRIGNILPQVLTDWRKHSASNGPEDFVFCNAVGERCNPDVLRKDVLYPVLDRLGIPRLPRVSGFHRFRHSGGSIINEKTGNLKLAQKFLRHSNISTTADIYTHTSDEAERKAAVVLEKAILGDLFPIVPKIETGNSSRAVQ